MFTCTISGKHLSMLHKTIITGQFSDRPSQTSTSSDYEDIPPSHPAGVPVGRDHLHQAGVAQVTYKVCLCHV